MLTFEAAPSQGTAHIVEKLKVSTRFPKKEWPLFAQNLTNSRA